MKKEPNHYSFWTRYQRFAGNEILLYLIMIVGIIAGIVVISWLKD